MSDHVDQNMTDHEYDGIRELDNNLPTWWLAIFGGTVIFAAIYWLHYEIAGGPTSDQELAQAMEVIQSMKKAGPSLGENELIALFDEPTLQAGKEVYVGKCAACHGSSGEGLIGPNLTDKFWLHGQGTRVDVMKVISDGVPEKGMPPWNGVLSEKELLAVTGYVHSLQGKNLPGRPPQGNEVP